MSSSTGASRMTKKDFVSMAKDSHLIDVTSKKSKKIGASSKEALAAVAIQSAILGRTSANEAMKRMAVNTSVLKSMFRRFDKSGDGEKYKKMFFYF